MALTACYKVAGGYRIYYAPYDTAGDDFPAIASYHYIGMTGPEGFRMNKQTLFQEVGADQLGGTIVDVIHQGANMDLEFVVQDYSRESVQSLVYPFHTTGTTTTIAVDSSDFGISGACGSGYMGTLWMYPIAGTPAAALEFGGGVVGTNAMQFKGMNIGPVTFNMDGTARFVPIRFRCFPFLTSSTGVMKHFNWITNADEPANEWSFV